jgi:hypothetical protein
MREPRGGERFWIPFDVLKAREASCSAPLFVPDFGSVLQALEGKFLQN